MTRTLVFYDYVKPIDIGYLPTDKETQAANLKQRKLDNWRKICDNLRQSEPQQN